MIEVEIKCKPTPEQEAALLNGATFVREERLTDIYYDSPTYELSLKDFWLRTRNGSFVLKTPATTCPLLAQQANTPKHELEDEATIQTTLGISGETLKNALANAGYAPRYTLTKIRKKYTKDGFIIDIDHATFEHLSFHLCEIELMVDTPEEISEATNKIVTFAKNHGITIENIPGNLIALIKEVNPEHYAHLEKARAARSK